MNFASQYFHVSSLNSRSVQLTRVVARLVKTTRQPWDATTHEHLHLPLLYLPLLHLLPSLSRTRSRSKKYFHSSCMLPPFFLPSYPFFSLFLVFRLILSFFVPCYLFLLSPFPSTSLLPPVCLFLIHSLHTSPHYHTTTQFL